MGRRSISRNVSKISEDSLKHGTKLEQDFILGESLGRGGFGQIVKVRRICDDNEYAIKIIKFVETNMEDMDKNRREAKMLAKLDHKNIVRYFSSWVETAQVPLAEYESLLLSDGEESLSKEIVKLSQNGYITDDLFNNNDSDNDDYSETNEDDEDSIVTFHGSNKEIFKEISYLCIQMELCDTRTLRTIIDQDLYLEEAKLMKYFTEICEGLSYIHQQNIVHRDLKPENIFLTPNDVIKIGDFGLSKQIFLVDGMENNLPSGELPFGSLSEICGTPVYIAPELFKKRSFNTKVDMYSLGVIYFEMCSKPMTGMEKQKIFPLSPSKLKTINFVANNSKKRFIIRNLLHLNEDERATCDDILKILRSQKSMDEIKEIMKQKKKIPFPQLRLFTTNLTSINREKTDLTTYFLNTAAKIFELHGAKNIPMPTFLPPLYGFSDNLTTLLNTRGNSSSVSNTSRIAFSNYVAKNNINEIRRYSTGKAFEEGFFSPTEIQECVFQAVSPEPNDHVNDAEVLFVVKEIWDKVFTRENGDLYFLINHKIIFSSIFKYCGIKDNRAAVFIMTNLSNVNLSEIPLRTVLAGFDLSDELLDFLLTIQIPRTIDEAEKLICIKMKNKKLTAAFKQLKAVATYADKFGISSKKILLAPLLINQNSPSFMFKVICDAKGALGHQVIANGDRFESLINRCRGKKKAYIMLSAIELSFSMDTIVRLLRVDSCAKKMKRVDVVIKAKEKATAIPIFKRLLSMEIKCEIVKELKYSDEQFSECPSYVIDLKADNHVIVYSARKNLRNITEVFRGCWQSSDFLNIVCSTADMRPTSINYSQVQDSVTFSNWNIC